MMKRNRQILFFDLFFSFSSRSARLPEIKKKQIRESTGRPKKPPVDEGKTKAMGHTHGLFLCLGPGVRYR